MGIPAQLSSVPAQTPYVQYVATSEQTVFPYNFEITQDSDLIVVANGVTLNTDSGYAVSGVGNSTGGNVTFTSGRTVDDIITLYRDIPISRLTQIAQNSGFSSAVFNNEFNNIYLLLQQLSSDIAQCLQIPNTNNPAPITTLDPTSYAGKYLSFDSNGNPTPAQLTSSGSLTQAIIAGLLYPRTAAEIAAGVMPTDFSVPSHLEGVGVILTRYGGDPSGATPSDAAMTAAIAVAGQLDAVIYIPPPNVAKYWLFENPWVLAGTGQAFAGIGPPVGGAGAQGARVYGLGCGGRVPIVFNLTGNTRDCIQLGGANLPQVELRHLQFNFQKTGLDGCVILGANRPIIDNVLFQNSYQDSFVLSVTGANFVEKGSFDVMVRYAGRHGCRMELLGTAGQGPYINECLWTQFEVRGVSQVTAGGNAVRVTGDAGLGAGAKVSNHFFAKTNFDCVYNTGALVPDTNVVHVDTVTAQTFTFTVGGWENTGTAGSPGAGYPVAVTGGGSLSGCVMLGMITNSLWGVGQATPNDPNIAGLFDFNYSFGQVNLQAALTLTLAAGGKQIITASGNTTADQVADALISRTGAASDLVNQGANIELFNSTTSTALQIMENGQGDILVWSYSGGTWGIKLRILHGAGGGLKINENFTVWPSGGVPSAATGANGDYAFNYSAGAGTDHIYYKTGGAWTALV